MPLFEWLKRRRAGDDTAELVIDASEDEFSGLSLKQVIEAHMAWIDRLRLVLDGKSTEQLDIQQVSCDDLCALGQWIHGPARKLYSDMPEYTALKQTHARFHACAGAVLQDQHNHDYDRARHRLKGEFRALSGQIQLDLVSLYARALNRR